MGFLDTLLAILWWPLVIWGCVLALFAIRVVAFLVAEFFRPPPREPQPRTGVVHRVYDPLERQWKLPAAEPRRRVR